MVLVGDSAGGNLAIGVAMRLAALGARRPDAVVACYPVRSNVLVSVRATHHQQHISIPVLMPG